MSKERARSVGGRTKPTSQDIKGIAGLRVARPRKRNHSNPGDQNIKSSTVSIPSRKKPIDKSLTRAKFPRRTTRETTTPHARGSGVRSAQTRSRGWQPASTVQAERMISENPDIEDQAETALTRERVVQARTSTVNNNIKRTEYQTHPLPNQPAKQLASNLRLTRKASKSQRDSKFNATSLLGACLLTTSAHSPAWLRIANLRSALEECQESSLRDTDMRVGLQAGAWGTGCQNVGNGRA